MFFIVFFPTFIVFSVGFFSFCLQFDCIIFSIDCVCFLFPLFVFLSIPFRRSSNNNFVDTFSVLNAIFSLASNSFLLLTGVIFNPNNFTIIYTVFIKYIK